MSGPVPSPSMKGMIGLLGTVSLPPAMVIAAPPGGGTKVASAMKISQGTDADIGRAVMNSPPIVAVPEVGEKEQPRQRG